MPVTRIFQNEIDQFKSFVVVEKTRTTSSENETNKKKKKIINKN